MANGNGGGWIKSFDPKIVAWIIAAILYLAVEGLKMYRAPTAEIVHALEEINSDQGRWADSVLKLLDEQTKLLRTADAERTRALQKMDDVIVPKLKDIDDSLSEHRRSVERSGEAPRGAAKP